MIMGKRIYPELLRIDKNRPVTAETDSRFLLQLSESILLALKERGLLNEMQYKNAETRLNQKKS